MSEEECACHKDCNCGGCQCGCGGQGRQCGCGQRCNCGSCGCNQGCQCGCKCGQQPCQFQNPCFGMPQYAQPLQFPFNTQCPPQFCPGMVPPPFCGCQFPNQPMCGYFCMVPMFIVQSPSPCGPFSQPPTNFQMPPFTQPPTSFQMPPFYNQNFQCPCGCHLNEEEEEGNEEECAKDEAPKPAAANNTDAK